MSGFEGESFEKGEQGVTMLEVVEEECRLEEQARLVLGGSDLKKCSYPQGYVKRQAVFSCLTCNPSHTTSQPGGVCLACSLTCHEGHDMVELYTKRNFRCDCGNARFLGNTCKLEPQKDVINDKNIYNHNFRGCYCVCGRPYPDPEVDEQEEMLQCVVCEDWFHLDHVLSEVPTGDDSFEFACEQCAKKFDYLRCYKVEEGGDSDLEGRGKKRKICEQNGKTSSGSGVPQGGGCKIEELPVEGVPQGLFLSEGWREELCRCEKCLERYKNDQVEFLMDPEDTMTAYEEKGKEKEKEESVYEQALSAIGHLDYAVQLEVLASFNDMKTHLVEFLEGFRDEGRVVGEEDIVQFFEEMRKTKRRRFV